MTRPRPIANPCAFPAALAALAILALALPQAGLAQEPAAEPGQELVLRRIAEAPTGGPEPSPPELPAPVPLPVGEETEWREEVWRVSGVTRFRIESPAEEPIAALRFYPVAPGSEELELRVMLFAQPERREHLPAGQSQVLRRGKIVPAPVFRPRDGIWTELSGEPGRVVRIVVQDDHLAELRLRQEGQLLVLEAVTPEYGGRPTGTAEPWYAGEELTFLDYGLLAGGYTDNGIGSLLLFDFFALRFNGFVRGSSALILARAVARTQMWRGENQALWLEGGGAAYEDTRPGDDVDNDGEEDATTLTWTFGATYDMRWGDWGAAAHLSTIDGPLVMELYGGWQVFDTLGAFLAWHSFEGSSAFAAGVSWDY